MKTILMPTDFSKNAAVAARYAAGFAKQHGYSIHFLHIYKAFTSAFQSELANDTDETRARVTAEREMQEFLDRVVVPDDVPVTQTIRRGQFIDEVSKFLREHPMDMVIMGTHGASGRKNDFLGSNTYDVSKTVSVPLLVVPEHIARFQVSRVVFFTDFADADARTLKALKGITPGNDEACTLVHIGKPADSTDDSKSKKLKEWEARLQSETGYTNLSSELVFEKEDRDVTHQIIDRLGADLTVLTLVTGRGFFEKLIHKSLARTIILHAKTPVLLYSGAE